MTNRELENFLVGEKEIAASKLGCNMCGKYARCLFCAQSEEFPCASAHHRLEAAVKNANVKLPAWLLPEPPLDGETVVYQHAPVSVKASYERTAEEMKIPMSQNSAEGGAQTPDSDRAEGGVLVRARTYDGVRLLKIRKKR